MTKALRTTALTRSSLVPPSASLLMLLVIATFTAGSARAAEWQWSIPLTGVTVGDEGQPRAFLWIPPDCTHVRAVVMGQNNMEEEPILENPRFRAALAELGFAEVWTTPGFDLFFRFDRGAGDRLTRIMNDLATESGYQEIAAAPLVPIGHSAAASSPWNIAAWEPARTLAVMSVSGQWPYYKDVNTPPWDSRTVDYVPGLVTMGEYEGTEGRAGDGLPQRQAHPLTPLSALQCPAEGHFAPTNKKIDYLALYLKKAAQYRLPADAADAGSIQLKQIDPTKQGWLADRWHSKSGPTAPAAPVASYSGDPAQAFWFFDEEIAKATETYEAEGRGKKVDLLGYIQDGQVVPQTNSHQQVNLKFEPQADGITFKLTAGFLDTVPGGSGRPAGWTGLPAGSPISHASNADAISIDRICGPVTKLSSDTFQVHFDKVGMNNKHRSVEIWLAATHPGDDQYKPMVQQSLLRIPFRNTKGPAQHITFPLIEDQKEPAGSVEMMATSDAGAPVSYYVLAGPAEIHGSKLTFTPIPPRAKFPVKVTVVAWQYGRAGEQPLQTAEPVEQSFVIEALGAR
jgi:hypothetical protein